MVSRASTKLGDNGNSRDLRAASIDDLVRDGIYARFIAGCFRDRVRLCTHLSLLVEVGNAINDGATSMRTIEDKLLERLERLPAKMNVSQKSVGRACKKIGELLGINVLVVTRCGSTPCSFTAEGRILWEETVRWNQLGLLESQDFVDFHPVLRLARNRDNSEQNAGGNQNIQRE